MATIDRFTSRTQAQLACGLLTAHGIDAYVSSDDAGGAYPQLPYGHGGTVVVVPDELLEAALALLDDGPPDGDAGTDASDGSASTPDGGTWWSGDDDAREAGAVGPEDAVLARSVTPGRGQVELSGSSSESGDLPGVGVQAPPGRRTRAATTVTARRRLLVATLAAVVVLAAVAAAVERLAS